MKVTISYDFGEKDLAFSSDIKISVNVETTLGNSYFIPEIRAVVAGGLAPLLKHLGMSDRIIEKEIEALMMSGTLFDNLKFPYFYDVSDRVIRSHIDKDVKYSIRDYLEGKVPDLSV